MNPRTEEERRVLELSATLPYLDLEENFNFDIVGKIEEVLDYMSYNSSYYVNGEWLKPNWEEVQTMAQLTAIEDYQVIRYYVFDCNQHYINGYLHYKDGEVAQRWIRDGRQVAFLAKKAHNNHAHWCLKTDLEIRSDYDFGVLDSIAVDSVLDRAFVWDAVKDNCKCLSQKYGRRISDPFLFTAFGEFLWKCERDLFRHAEKNGIDNLVPFEQSIRVAHRHDYKIADIGLWLDYLQQLRKLGRDMHSPHYVCPEDLNKAHEITNRQMQALIEKERILEERKKAERATKENADYIKRMKKFFDLCFVGAGIEITPLKSVTEFYEEGKAMHHCVYTNGYYKDGKNCLIMSAKDAEGNRIETVEVNLKNYSVAQSRAVLNGTSGRHEEIVNLVMQHMGEIRSARKVKTNYSSTSVGAVA